ncbi:MAG TPA: cobyric acid synthase [Oscillospiraceae bacterium]|nr:cobyric acid synthase [Oscillospiraceae bacterium]HNW03870.1 cobyric acid synthase [Oscillospiraceae bacterium]
MAKTIMVQGTTSNAGKSFLCAALCRIFRQDGYAVAPFKSQNMALNSYITSEGLEMGRAQVMQAEAAGVEPSVRMNPILLKPTGDTRSQVIVNGRVRGDFTAREYFAMKQSLIPEIQNAFESLAAGHDIVVIEGAGSPAEINLKRDDVVNMGMAAMADAPVLLCGNIDPGGVFASLYGTVKLLDEADQRRIRGLIVNKFRGDVTILEPGLRTLEGLVGRPVVGVVPYLPVDLDDEDSLSERFSQKAGTGAVDVAVIRLPHISNFTDFNPLQRMGEVTLRYVETPGRFGRPDLVILPGTKNTMGDLAWLREAGLEEPIRRHAESGGAVVGVCGGYQMLGRRLSDPLGVEAGGEAEGLCLLPCDTVFASGKTRTRTAGTVAHAEGVFSALQGAAFDGYEIHMGKTSHEHRAFALLDGDRPDGLSHGNVFGTYVHGLFDRAEFASRFVDCLLAAKGLPPAAPAEDWDEYKEKQYDLLASGVRAALDMDKIYQILEKTDELPV